MHLAVFLSHCLSLLLLLFLIILSILFKSWILIIGFDFHAVPGILKITLWQCFYSSIRAVINVYELDRKSTQVKGEETLNCYYLLSCLIKVFIADRTFSDKHTVWILYSSGECCEGVNDELNHVCSIVQLRRIRGMYIQNHVVINFCGIVLLLIDQNYFRRSCLFLSFLSIFGNLSLLQYNIHYCKIIETSLLTCF